MPHRHRLKDGQNQLNSALVMAQESRHLKTRSRSTSRSRSQNRVCPRFTPAKLARSCAHWPYTQQTSGIVMAFIKELMKNHCMTSVFILCSIMLPWNRVLTSSRSIFQTSIGHVLVALAVITQQRSLYLGRIIAITLLLFRRRTGSNNYHLVIVITL
jgi:hypothetical protein